MRKKYIYKLQKIRDYKLQKIRDYKLQKIHDGEWPEGSIIWALQPCKGWRVIDKSPI